NLQAAEAAREGAIAQLKKNEIEAEFPDVTFARRNHERAQRLFEQKLVPQSGLDEARNALEQAENRQRAAGSQLVMALGDIERVFVRGRVDEADIGRVRLGQAARITTEAFRDRTFEGCVTEI